jgi:hypothetical protein
MPPFNEEAQMTAYQTATPPSLPQLAKATALALAVSGAILVGAVLPAEYGIDPIGIGKALGLTKLNGGAAKPAELVPAPAGSTATLSRTDHALRSDEMSVTLQPGEGAEIKAEVRKGQQFVFSWATDGAPVKSDMHGEPFNAKPNEFTTYWKVPQQSGAQGAFVAPFDGIHGWFWRNKGDKPVTVKVKVTGFHEKLYRPAAQ